VEVVNSNHKQQDCLGGESYKRATTFMALLVVVAIESSTYKTCLVVENVEDYHIQQDLLGSGGRRGCWP